MIIFGIVIVILGVVSAVYGNHLNNDFEVQLENLFETGTTDPGDIFMFVGIAAAVVGLILFVMGLIKRTKNNPLRSDSKIVRPFL